VSKKIGIFSGVFDPVHNGHVAFARMAAKELGLNKVYFLVEPKPRRKKQVSDINDRQTMVWLAIQGFPELEVLTLPDQTFSVAKTLPWLEQNFKKTELYMLMGSDLFAFVETWPGYKDLAKRVAFVVGQRTNEMHDGNPTTLHHLLLTPHAGVASTAVRTQKKANTGLISPEVDRYIRLNKLYSSSAKSK